MISYCGQIFLFIVAMRGWILCIKRRRIAVWIIMNITQKSRKYELKPRADGTAPRPRVGRVQGGYWDHQGLLPGSWDFFFTLVVRTSCAQFHVTNNNHQLLQLGAWNHFYINIMKIWEKCRHYLHQLWIKVAPNTQVPSSFSIFFLVSNI